MISGKRRCCWVFQIYIFFFEHQNLCAISFYHFWAKADISTADISITWQLTSTARKRKNKCFWSWGELSLLRQVFGSTQSETNSLQICSHMIHYVFSCKPTVSHLNLSGSLWQVCKTITTCFWENKSKKQTWLLDFLLASDVALSLLHMIWNDDDDDMSRNLELSVGICTVNTSRVRGTKIDGWK